jgi:hypothetical protein
MTVVYIRPLFGILINISYLITNKKDMAVMIRTMKERGWKRMRPSLKYKLSTAKVTQ